MTTTPAETITEQTVVAIAQLIWSVVDDDETRAMNATSLAGTLIRDMAGKLQALPSATLKIHWPTSARQKRSEENLQRLLDAAQTFINEEGT